MFPYTAEEADWLSTPADSRYWLRGEDEAAPATSADAEVPAR
jgi:hypothetical protein